jgi:hypothetical protein
MGWRYLMMERSELRRESINWEWNNQMTELWLTLSFFFPNLPSMVIALLYKPVLIVFNWFYIFTFTPPPPNISIPYLNSICFCFLLSVTALYLLFIPALSNPYCCIFCTVISLINYGGLFFCIFQPTSSSLWYFFAFSSSFRLYFLLTISQLLHIFLSYIYPATNCPFLSLFQKLFAFSPH